MLVAAVTVVTTIAIVTIITMASRVADATVTPMSTAVINNGWGGVVRIRLINNRGAYVP